MAYVHINGAYDKNIHRGSRKEANGILYITLTNSNGANFVKKLSS